MSSTRVILGGFASSLVGAMLGALLAGLAAPELQVVVSGATIGAIAGSALGWIALISPRLPGGPVPGGPVKEDVLS